MSAVPQVAQRYSVEDYLRLEEETGEKWEFFDGEVFRWDAMAGATTPHNRISANAGRTLDNAFIAAKRPCGSLNSDQKLSVVRTRRYRYPDMMAVCGTPKFDGNLADALLNPSLVLEVVSDSSRYMDYVKKLLQYEKVEDIRDYVIVEQKIPFMTVHSRERGDESFTAVKYHHLDALVRLPSVGVEVPLGEFYRDIVWTDEGPELQPGAGIPSQPADDFDDEEEKV